MIKLLLADDHQMFLDALTTYLSGEPDFEILDTAQNGRQAMESYTKQQPDVFITDINMPDADGISAVKQIKKTAPEVQVIMLSMVCTKEKIFESLKAGASGFVLKNCAGQELKKAIHSVYRRENYFCKEVTDMVFASLKKIHRLENSYSEKISPRETEIIKLIAEEYTTKEIAKKLFISENTVESHRKNILSKFNVRNTAGLIKYALLNGLLEE